MRQCRVAFVMSAVVLLVPLTASLVAVIHLEPGVIFAVGQHQQVRKALQRVRIGWFLGGQGLLLVDVDQASLNQTAQGLQAGV